MSSLLALLLVFAAPLVAAEAETNPTWSRYFPNVPAAPADERGWAELAKSLPHRVKAAPDAASETLQPPPATRTELRPGIDYVRVRQLASDLPTIEQALTAPRLIIDLRYVRGDLEESLEFAALLARRPFSLHGHARTVAPRQVRPAGQVTLCLINRATAGPLEAVLDALQQQGAVLLVGTQSAGDTGHFQPVVNAPEWRVIVDDYRREHGPSLLDVGVTPGLFVETSPDIEDAAYLAFDAGRPAADLLDAPVEKQRFDEARLQQHFDETRPGNGNGPRASNSTSAADDQASDSPADEGKDAAEASTPPQSAAAEDTREEADDPPPFDRSLQRAVSTLVAHHVLRGAKPEPR